MKIRLSWDRLIFYNGCRYTGKTACLYRIGSKKARSSGSRTQNSGKGIEISRHYLLGHLQCSDQKAIHSGTGS